MWLMSLALAKQMRFSFFSVNYANKDLFNQKQYLFLHQIRSKNESNLYKLVFVVKQISLNYVRLPAICILF